MAEDQSVSSSTNDENQNVSFDMRAALSIVTGCVLLRPFAPVAELVQHLTGVSIKHSTDENKYDLLKFMELQEPCRMVLVENFPKLAALEIDFNVNCKPSLGGSTDKAFARVNLWLYKNNLGKPETAKLSIPALLAKDLVPTKSQTKHQLFRVIRNDR